ncbi:MAG: S41 family peptidase [Acidobacteriia bacterium]|nr:S41 family peptidase [Terriglobia bacterium]
MKSSRLTWTVLWILVACSLVGGTLGRYALATSASHNEDADSTLKTFSQVMGIIQENYAEPVDPQAAVTSAINGMLRTLDPHSTFFDAKAFSALREEQSGKYYGVGMTVSTRNGKTVVIAPFVGSPAYRAGIRPGDIIARVNDKPTDNLSVAEVANLLKGPRGTIVKVTIQRVGSPLPLEFTITRDEIPRRSIDFAYRLKNDIGYIRINNFNETTDRELAESLQAIGQDTLKGLVLDLRDNPGGLLNEGVGVADTFLQKGQLIVYTKGRSHAEQRFTAPHGNGNHNYPLVVLINSGSASAAEIVAGAIQDHDRGLIVGEISFGKGLVQTVYPLDGHTGLALTVAKWYTPSGRLIQRDYTHQSFFDYFYGPKHPAEKPTMIKLTDGGREVYGGGGITPDVKVETPTLSPFVTLLLQKYVFFNFTSHYLAEHEKIGKDFVVDENVIADFRKFLDSEKVRYTEPDIQHNLKLIQQTIKYQLFLSQFGQVEAYRITLDNDEQVQKAIELMPQAKALAENARKVVAQRVSVK